MSIIVTHEMRCDFCGEVLEEKRSVFFNHENFKSMQPTLRHIFVQSGATYDLCGNCSLPIFDAKQKRIDELREQGKLKGIPK